MKKLLVVVAFVATGIMANAQEIKVGAKAGVNFAKITGDVTNVESLTGFHIGAMAEIGITEAFAVQPELLYSTQGAKAKEGDGEYNFNYITVPVTAKYYVIEGLSLELGPQIGFLASAKVKSSEGSTDIKKNIKSIDFGLNFGAGYRLDNGLSFSARYNVGMSNINDRSGNKDNIKNGVFQLSVGYFFF